LAAAINKIKVIGIVISVFSTRCPLVNLSKQTKEIKTLIERALK